MRIRLTKLQDNNKKARKLRSKKLSQGWEDIEEILHYQSFPYVLKIIYSELINKYYNNPLVSHFGIKKT